MIRSTAAVLIIALSFNLATFAWGAEPCPYVTQSTDQELGQKLSSAACPVLIAADQDTMMNEILAAGGGCIMGAGEGIWGEVTGTWDFVKLIAHFMKYLAVDWAWDGTKAAVKSMFGSAPDAVSGAAGAMQANAEANSSLYEEAKADAEAAWLLVQNIAISIKNNWKEFVCEPGVMKSHAICKVIGEALPEILGVIKYARGAEEKAAEAARAALAAKLSVDSEHMIAARAAKKAAEESITVTEQPADATQRIFVGSGRALTEAAKNSPKIEKFVRRTEKLLGRELNETEQAALVEQKKMFPNKSYFDYSDEEVTAKLEVLRKAGFSSREAMKVFKAEASSLTEEAKAAQEARIAAVKAQGRAAASTGYSVDTGGLAAATSRMKQTSDVVEWEEQSVDKLVPFVQRIDLAERHLNYHQNELFEALEARQTAADGEALALANKKVVENTSNLITERDRLAALKGTHDLDEAIDEYHKNRVFMAEFTDPERVGELLEGASGAKGQQQRFESLVRSAAYSGMDDKKLTEVIEAAVKSRKLGDPRSALKASEEGMSKAIEKATAKVDEAGLKAPLLRYQALKNAEARMVIYRARVQELIRAKNGGTLPANWEAEMQKAPRYKAYADQIAELRSAAQ
jgi:hypothetical protein